MKQIIFIFEDVIHQALLEIISSKPDGAHWHDSRGKSQIDKRMESYVYASQHQKVIVMRDLDHDAECAPSFIGSKIAQSNPVNFSLRIPVRTAETWLLADKEGFSRYFNINLSHLERVDLEELDNPKQFTLNLLQNSRLPASRKRQIVESNRGAFNQRHGYNIEMTRFIRTHWNLTNAANNSDSLRRAVRNIQHVMAS